MLVRPVTPDEKTRFNALAAHPTQCWEWGDFRAANGQTIARLGVFDDSGQMQDAVQVTFHPIPYLGGTAGYYSKGPLPTPEILAALKDVGQQQQAVFIKLEPNAWAPADAPQPFTSLEQILAKYGAVPAKRLFTTYSFIKDLTLSEDELMQSFKSKTRYNIRVAQKHGVQVREETNPDGLETYLHLLCETTARQRFYAHNEQYFRQMWEKIGSTGMMRIITARYQDQVVAAWILFIWGPTAYYPYGASSSQHREVMASNLLMWEALRLAKQAGCTTFDMWGALGPEPDTGHKWYGFHRFKEGYAADHMQSPPTYDLVLNPSQYRLFKFGDTLRWTWLRWRATLGV